MPNNTNLNIAKSAKNDEFYTRIEDIEKELKYYKDFFKGKVVYCNCDRADGENRSNFFVYFVENFKEFGLKRLICTSYNKGGKGRLCIYNGNTNLNNIIDMDGDGDFRSEECIKWLEECDVVVTNPPFSLFRDFVAQLVKYGKKFLIIGNMNAITYKEIFPLIKDNKIWLGVNGVNKDWYFHITDECKEHVVKEKKEGSAWKMVNGEVMGRLAIICWFTNIEHSKLNLPLDLYKKYNPKDYPKYDNYNAINVDKVTDIPMDYDGVMGVPITFLDKYCPTQFEIVGIPLKSLTINGKKVYKRIMIRKIKS